MKKILALILLSLLVIILLNQKELKQQLCKYSPNICFSIGKIQLKLENPKKALKYFLIACNNNMPTACNNLGHIYFQENEIEENIEKAYKAFSKACNHGNPRGCTNLGVLLTVENAEIKNYKKAIDIFRSTCLRFYPYDPLACYHLGYVYHYGFGVDVSLGAAYNLYPCLKKEIYGCAKELVKEDIARDYSANYEKNYYEREKPNPTPTNRVVLTLPCLSLSDAACGLFRIF